MTASIPSPDEIIGFPKDNPRLKIVNHKGLLYVVERFYRWSPEKKRGVEDRTYVGKILDGRFTRWKISSGTSNVTARPGPSARAAR